MKFVVGTIVVLVLSALLAPVASGGDELVSAERWGYLIGYGTAPLLLGGLVLLVARLMGKAKAPGAGAKVVFWTAATVFVLNIIGVMGRGAITASPPSPVTEAERQGLEIGPDSIRHRGFGFALPHPGTGFHPAPDMQRLLEEQFATQPEVGGWALQDSGSGGVVVVLITKAGRVSETTLRAFAKGVRKGVGTEQGWGVLEDTIEWVGPGGEYRFWARNEAPAYLGIRCLPGRRPEASVIVCVETVSRGGDDGLRFVRAGLAVAP
jgi:hypothetical protein